LPTPPTCTCSCGRARTRMCWPPCSRSSCAVGARPGPSSLGTPPASHQQGRHSTLNSYCEKLLFLLTGHFGRKGTNNRLSWPQPLILHAAGERSAVTGQEQIAGLYPPNRFPAEVLTDHPDRLRAVWVDSNNTVNTGANTQRFEQALRALEFLVVVDVAMTETAALAHYVLPAAPQYATWEYTLFTFKFPPNYFHLRTPLIA